MRRSQIAYESGVSSAVDPLGGSYHLEWLTDRMEEEITRLMDELDAYGGVEKAIDDGYMQMRVAERALERKQRKDSGETVVVGENYFAQEMGAATDYGEIFSSDPTSAALITKRLTDLRAQRDNAAVITALDRLEQAAQTDGENLLPYLVDCCHAYATVGEMVARLKRCWGEFREPIRL